MRNKATVLAIGLFVHHTITIADVKIETGMDAEANLPFWQISDEGMSLRLVQRLPDQTRGYFMARGFSKPDADLIARSCLFQTIFKNESSHTQPSDLEYNLRDWVVTVGSNQQGLKVREDWQQEWVKRKINKAAQVAFEWSLYPTQQIYRPGDYNWGMSLFNLPPGTKFDLNVVWRQFGKNRSATIKGMQCADDVHPQPGSERQP